MEDFGIVPFEFLACGKPLIVVDKGGYVNLIKDYPQVIFVREKEDLESEIFKAMENLISERRIKKIKFKKSLEKEFIYKLDSILKNKN